MKHILKPLVFILLCAAQITAFGRGIVALISQEGDKVIISEQVARLSGTLNNIIEDTGVADPIVLKDISKDTLDRLIIMLEKLNPLVQKKDETYIPRAYQPSVNDLVDLLGNYKVGELMNAAIYLDLPFIVNALAAVIADRIHTDFTGNWMGLEYVNARGAKVKRGVGARAQREDTNTILGRINYEILDNGFGEIPLDKIAYVLKHLIFRERGIKQEYSIADYLKKKKVGGTKVDLDKLRLTSLFGIKKLLNPKKITDLGLSNNTFFRLDLDVQGVDRPFEGFASLRKLNLQNAKLFALKPNLFKGLEDTTVYLGGNPVSPSDQKILRKTLGIKIIFPLVASKDIKKGELFMLSE